MASLPRNPNQLPTKTCPVCLRDFTWRKKWERNWEEVRYCSDKCRSLKKSNTENILADIPAKRGQPTS